MKNSLQLEKIQNSKKNEKTKYKIQIIPESQKSNSNENTESDIDSQLDSKIFNENLMNMDKINFPEKRRTKKFSFNDLL